MGVRPTHAVLSSISTPVLFGNKAIESSLDENAPGWAEAFPFVAGTSGTMSALTIYIDAQSQATKLIVGVYTDAHGQPGSLVASGSLSSPKAGTWNKVPVQSAAIQSGATYWAAVLGRGGTLFFRDRSFGPCTSVNSLQHSLAALPSAWTGGYTWSTCPISAYATGMTAPPSGGGTTSPPTGTAPTPVTTPDPPPTTSTPSPPPPTPLPPVELTAPTITGNAVNGQLLTASTGTWLNTPTSYAYQWQDCNSSGSSCSNIGGATGNSYGLASGDVGHTVRAKVTATNSGGSGSANSAVTGVVQAPSSAPSNTSPPTISGTAQQGQSLVAGSGSWSGTAPISYTYQWQSCASTCSDISGAAGSTYLVQSSDVGHTVDVVATATNSSGSSHATSGQTATVTASSGGSSGLPSGVTLQQIDGGPNYYCSNGFSNACSSSFNGMSWDDPRFFPIADDYSFYPNSNTSTFKALGLNTSVRVTGDTDLSVLKNAGIWAIPAPGEGKNPGPETVGWHIEEPSSWSQIKSAVQAIGSGLTGRFLHISSTWSQFVYGGYSGTPGDGSMQAVMSSPISTSVGNVHLNIPTADEYWFAGSGASTQQYNGSLIYGGTGSATADQMARGSNYGDMVDQMRDWLTPTKSNPTSYSAPTCPYIETEDGLLTDSGKREITPPELNWAVWSTIIHGARCIMYFGTTSNYGSGATFGFSQNVLPGQTVSMYNQAIATDGEVKNLAPIINSPFALHYASVTPAGYTFPAAHVVWDSGIDISAHYYTGGGYTNSTGTFANGFYIFASVRGSESQSNINASFTTADGYTGPVTVVGENRTVQATGGHFSDTFAHASTVHVYDIP